MFNFISKLSAWDQTFFYLAFGATILFLGQIILTFVGFDDDADIDLDSDSGFFQLLTAKNIVSFLVALGWSGLAFHIEAGLSKTLSIIFAIITGITFMFIQASLMWLMYKLHAPNDESTIPEVGATGTVYLSIPENGMGKISININGKLTVVGALSLDGLCINTNESIQVVKLSGGYPVVKKISNQ